MASQTYVAIILKSQMYIASDNVPVLSIVFHHFIIVILTKLHKCFIVVLVKYWLYNVVTVLCIFTSTPPPPTHPRVNYNPAPVMTRMWNTVYSSLFLDASRSFSWVNSIFSSSPPKWIIHPTVTAPQITFFWRHNYGAKLLKTLYVF